MKQRIINLVLVSLFLFNSFNCTGAGKQRTQARADD